MRPSLRYLSRHGACLGTVIVMAMLVATLPALAGTVNGKNMKSHARPERVKSSKRFVFKTGTLHLDRFGNWVLGDGTPLLTDDETLWTDEQHKDGSGTPSEGRMVKLMCQPGLRGLLIRQGTLLDPLRAGAAASVPVESVPDTPEPRRPH